jgi:CheY-like chemotaxis protein
MNKNKEITKRNLVFIIEDNDMYSMMIEYILSESDCYRFVKFSSGEECLANLNQKPDLIILDYYLPGMNGLNVLKQIKKTLANVPVLVLSKNMNKKEISELYKEGASEYMVKAKDSIKQLGAVLNKLLEKSNRENRSGKATLLIIFFWVMFTILFFAVLIKNLKFFLPGWKGL